MLFSPIRAHEKDTIAIAEHQNQWTKVLDNALHNPAFMHNVYTTSLSEMYLNLNYKHANIPQQPQLGNAHTLGNATVSS